MTSEFAHREAPVVSVIVPNFNGARYLTPLLRSLRCQSLSHIQIIVVDDASTDDSIALARKLADDDERIHVEALSCNSGPGAARNVGLSLARGTWVAVVDSDDLVHPCRLERLVAKAEANQADIVADDLLVFYDDGGRPHRFLTGNRARTAGEVSLADYVRENAIFTPRPALGFLKPIFRRAALKQLGLGYDETLRTGEDYDFVLRALAGGMRFWIEPMPYYLYRKHSQSVSRALKNADIGRMLTADRAFLQTHALQHPDLGRAFDGRFASLARAMAWNDLVDALKRRKLASALAIAIRTPSILPLLTWPIRARLREIRLRPSGPRSLDRHAAGNSICLISRQRLADATSGSSNYVLSIAGALQAAGHDVHLIYPSPTVFGRLPILRLQREAKVFKSIRMRGGMQLGSLIVAKDPRILAALARGILVRVGSKVGLKLEDRPAPYSVGAPWEPDDYLFVARHAPPLSDTILFDYGFQTDARPYILRPDARSFVIMHDLVSSRGAQFTRLGSADSLPDLSEREELRMLTGADVVVAIQEDEAAYVRQRTGGHKVICAPIAMRTADHPFPGERDSLLFVGTKTAPNVDGLNWFLAEVWPAIFAQLPSARLKVVGSVNRMVASAPRNVSMLGVVPDLTPLYQAAGVVISPLLAGSGLKIKLIEAMSHGKAIVSTSATVQGVGNIVGDAVIVADDSHDFADAVVALLKNDVLRAAKAELALAVAKRHFSPQACYSELLDAIRQAGPAPLA